jgi:hypothetical protein
LERHRRYRETRLGAFDRRSWEFCGIPIARAFSWHTLLKDDVDTTNDSRQINGTVDTATTLATCDRVGPYRWRAFAAP